MSTDTRLNLTPQFVMGVCLILFGALLTLDRLNLVDAAQSLRYWPIVLIALGAWIVFERGATGRSFPGYVMLAIGSLLLLNAAGLVRVRVWDLFWPVIIVLVGARLIVQTPGRRGARHRVRGFQEGQTGATPGSTDGDGMLNVFAVLGSDQRVIRDKAFRGGEITSIVCGTQLDLRQAAIAAGEQAVINIFVLMGGQELWVPAGWTVVIEVMPILGGVEDKRLPPVLDVAAGAPDGTAPRLVIRGIVLLGGLTIKN